MLASTEDGKLYAHRSQSIKESKTCHTNDHRQRISRMPEQGPFLVESDTDVYYHGQRLKMSRKINMSMINNYPNLQDQQ